MQKEENLKTEMEGQTQPNGRAFRVVITETLKRVITVHESELKNPTVDDAVQTVSDWWHNGQIILVAEDFHGVDFDAKEIEEGGGEDA